MAEAADVRVAQRLLDALGHLARAASAVRRGRWPAPSRARRGRRRGDRAGRRAGCRTRSRAGRGTAPARSLAAAISSPWRRTSSAVRPRTAPDGRRVIADRQVLVAALARGAAHLLDARPAVRPGRVAVQIAADLRRASTQRRRLAAERLLAQLRRTPGHAERPVDAVLVGRVGQRLERRDVRRRAGRAHQLGPEPVGLGDDQLDRHALDRHPDRVALAALDHRDDLRQRGEASRAPAPGRARRRPPRAARTSRASGARRRPPRRRARPRSPPTSSRARLSSSPCRGRGSPPRARAPRAAAPRSWARCPARRAAGPSAAASRNSSAVRTSSARASSIERFAPSPR